jgi:hypothetical protein
MWKHIMFLPNDPTKIMCFEHKTRMKVDHKIKILKLCIIEFFTNKFVIFYETFLSQILYVWACMHFLFFIVACTRLKCYITNDVHFIMCALCEKKKLKDLVNQKRKDVIFSSMFFLYISLFSFLISCGKHVCALIIWLRSMHHIIIV